MSQPMPEARMPGAAGSFMMAVASCLHCFVACSQHLHGVTLHTWPCST